tara:strand:+ start:856 stop:1158 length:303 start_codon:yes stop_codon:yes gene_type:complete
MIDENFNLSMNKGGIFVPLANRGKDKKLIPWRHIKKKTVHESVKHCTSPKNDIDVWLVDKTIKGQKFERLFSTEREALKALDIFLIKHGQEPRHILKRTT